MAIQITAVVPALNEEENLADAISSIRDAAKENSLSVEIIVVNDGSTDKTGLVAEKYADRVIHHNTPCGLGYSFFDGASLANGMHVIMIPGDNEILQSAISSIFSKASDADIVNSYSTNPYVRPFARQLLSKIFTIIVRFISGVSLHYFNGPTLYRTDLVKSSSVRASGFGYNSELLLSLIKSRATIIEVPVQIRELPGRSSRAFTIKNCLSVGISLLNIARYFLRIRFLRTFLTKEEINK